MRQNQAHGLLLRINVFLTAYFQYRGIAVAEQEHQKFKQQEDAIIKAMSGFLENLPALKQVSKVTWGLFIQTYGQVLKEVKL